MGSSTPTDTDAAISVISGKKRANAPTTMTSMDNDETCLKLQNYATTYLTALGNGNIGLGCIPTCTIDVNGAGRIYVENANTGIEYMLTLEHTTTGTPGTTIGTGIMFNFEAAGHGAASAYSIYARADGIHFVAACDVFVSGSVLVDNLINVGTMIEYTDNADAVNGGRAVGDFYRTGDIVKVVHL